MNNGELVKMVRDLEIAKKLLIVTNPGECALSKSVGFCAGIDWVLNYLENERYKLCEDCEK